MMRDDLSTWGLRLFTYLAMAFLFFPILITLVVSVNPREFILPPTGFTLEWFRAAWSSDMMYRMLGRCWGAWAWARLAVATSASARVMERTSGMRGSSVGWVTKEEC